MPKTKSKPSQTLALPHMSGAPNAMRQAADIDSLLQMPREVEKSLDDGTPLVISYSGGKDSDTLLLILKRLCQARGWPEPLMLHCDMGSSEWFCTSAYVDHRAAQENLALHVIRQENYDLLQRITRNADTRPETVIWMSSVARFCTSELKTQPTNSWIAHHVAPLDSRGKPCRPHPEHPERMLDKVVIAAGLRAEESPKRREKPVLSQRPKATSLLRTVLDWNPLHGFRTEDVWETLGLTLDDLRHLQTRCVDMLNARVPLAQIIQDLQWRWHPAYLLGNNRLSCSLCMLASRSDILNGITWNPGYYVSLVRLEARSGFSFKPDLWLGEMRPDLLPADLREEWDAMRAAPRPALYTPPPQKRQRKKADPQNPLF